MNTIEILDSKIKDLNVTINQLKNSNLDEKQKLEAQLVIIEECENVLKNEELMMNYDFSGSIDLLNSHHLLIENLESILLEVQQVIDVKMELNIPDMKFSDDQVATINQFIQNLSLAREELKLSIEDLNKSSSGKEVIENLESLKNVLSGSGKKKYYTEDMFDSFYDVIDWDNISLEDAKDLLSEFYKTKNLRGRQNKTKENMDNVVELYKEFLDEKEFAKSETGKFTGLFAALLYAHENEVTTFIDLDNTREILQFFEDNGILHEFGRNSLLKVSLFGNSEYVKKLYHKIKTEHPDEMELYFEDEVATLWVCESSTFKKNPFRISRKRGDGETTESSLYSQCHSVTEDEFRENIQFLNENSDLFDDKYDVKNFGAHLKAKTISSDELKNFKALLNLVTSSSWAFRKNFGLFRIFGLGYVSKIPISSLEHGDIEDKIHLAIELGLLNPPMNQTYKEMEKDIVKGEYFQTMQSKKKNYNQSIRNYFQRYISVLSILTVNEYAYMFYKLQNQGPVSFYNDFFSDKKAGQRSVDYLTESERQIITNKDVMEEFIARQFVTDLYSVYIKDYDEFDNVIYNYNEASKVSNLKNVSYYDGDITNDDMIKKIEENCSVNDLLIQDGKTVELKNEFVYKFGDTLISRYKVLHNATILKEKYGFLNEDMLLAAIVRNSFLNKHSFDYIDGILKERKKVK